ncbi:hypothetical protein DYB25_002335 [Aphanomyces astaci]|uniref:TLDc domain-containing protein n=1 Tax=Aphanomyces astaci TaxID=112090 RepID=A0A397DEB4_APHAT|nr:hypothetical protein DYB25_002335 [Aphanomyces astaci]RHY61251.1 hypothetical protein DYB38_002352 [Aphanomyces astaci]
MVLISDISPGPSYFLMMQNPWSDYDPTCVDRHHDILAQHGASLHTLFRRVRRQESTIVFVETEDGDIFGGFATAPWTPCGLYFGTGESFVFTCHRKFEMFPWTRKNSLLLFSDENTIAMGGGSVSSVHPSHDQPHGTMILVE